MSILCLTLYHGLQGIWKIENILPILEQFPISQMCSKLNCYKLSSKYLIWSIFFLSSHHQFQPKVFSWFLNFGVYKQAQHCYYMYPHDFQIDIFLYTATFTQQPHTRYSFCLTGIALFSSLVKEKRNLHPHFTDAETGLWEVKQHAPCHKINANSEQRFKPSPVDSKDSSLPITFLQPSIS